MDPFYSSQLDKLGIILLYIASCVDLKKYKKNPRPQKTTDGEKSVQRSPSCINRQASQRNHPEGGDCEGNLNDLKRAGPKDLPLPLKSSWGNPFSSIKSCPLKAINPVRLVTRQGWAGLGTCRALTKRALFTPALSRLGLATESHRAQRTRPSLQNFIISLKMVKPCSSAAISGMAGPPVIS